MKALILAAGFGTRLLPYTRTIPKPLFTLGSIPVLQHIIQQLSRCGCRHVLINTHHLPDRITAFLDSLETRMAIKISVIHEPEILDTGGAIANVRETMADQSFFVINGDVATDMDLASVWQVHLKYGPLATLVLHDRTEFNQVAVDGDGWISDFHSPGRGLAFTGIQVVSPRIFEHLPATRIFSSIDLYARLCPDRQIRAYVPPDIFWEDIGTPAAYSRTARRWISAGVLGTDIGNTLVHPLAGDGSDRSWFRACPGTASHGVSEWKFSSAVVCDHGICLPGTDRRAQLDAFVSIGNHLHSRNIPVPKILAHDALAGIVVLEDLGEIHLADWVNRTPDLAGIIRTYRKVIDRLVLFSQKGATGFDLSWTCQTPFYSKDLILEKECRYFLEAFVRNFMKKHVDFDAFLDDFSFIADHALSEGLEGLMHRDCQSKNIMIKNGTPFFIDFQSARLGPFQYDLASLLLDPYVTLPQQAWQDLLIHAMDRLNLNSRDSRQRFVRSFDFCCLTRNMQILGAFAHLSRVKKKPWFEAYIPAALASLKHLVQQMESASVRRLKKLILSL